MHRRVYVPSSKPWPQQRAPTGPTRPRTSTPGVPWLSRGVAKSPRPVTLTQDGELFSLNLQNPKRCADVYILTHKTTIPMGLNGPQWVPTGPKGSQRVPTGLRATLLGAPWQDCLRGPPWVPMGPKGVSTGPNGPRSQMVPKGSNKTLSSTPGDPMALPNPDSPEPCDPRRWTPLALARMALRNAVSWHCRCEFGRKRR